MSRSWLDVRTLVMRHKRTDVTYKLQSTRFRVSLDVFSYMTVRHPLRYHGQRGGEIGNSKEWGDVGMRQPFPNGDLLVEDLTRNG